MLTEEEQNFIKYWEANRDRENTLKIKLLRGGPIGLIFALPILIAVLFHDWYKRMIPITTSMLIMITICVIAIAFFYAYFRQQVRWEQRDQLYKELKMKEQQPAHH